MADQRALDGDLDRRLLREREAQDRTSASVGAGAEGPGAQGDLRELHAPGAARPRARHRSVGRTVSAQRAQVDLREVGRGVPARDEGRPVALERDAVQVGAGAEGRAVVEAEQRPTRPVHAGEGHRRAGRQVADEDVVEAVRVVGHEVGGETLEGHPAAVARDQRRDRALGALVTRGTRRAADEGRPPGAEVPGEDVGNRVGVVVGEVGRHRLEGHHAAVGIERGVERVPVGPHSARTVNPARPLRGPGGDVAHVDVDGGARVAVAEVRRDRREAHPRAVAADRRAERGPVRRGAGGAVGARGQAGRPRRQVAPPGVHEDPRGRGLAEVGGQALEGELGAVGAERGRVAAAVARRPGGGGAGDAHAVGGRPPDVDLRVGHGPEVRRVGGEGDHRAVGADGGLPRIVRPGCPPGVVAHETGRAGDHVAQEDLPARGAQPAQHPVALRGEHHEPPVGARDAPRQRLVVAVVEVGRRERRAVDELREGRGVGAGRTGDQPGRAGRERPQEDLARVPAGAGSDAPRRAVEQHRRAVARDRAAAPAGARRSASGPVGPAGPGGCVGGQIAHVDVGRDVGVTVAEVRRRREVGHPVAVRADRGVQALPRPPLSEAPAREAGRDGLVRRQPPDVDVPAGQAVDVGPRVVVHVGRVAVEGDAPPVVGDLRGERRAVRLAGDAVGAAHQRGRVGVHVPEVDVAVVAGVGGVEVRGRREHDLRAVARDRGLAAVRRVGGRAGRPADQGGARGRDGQDAERLGAPEVDVEDPGGRVGIVRRVEGPVGGEGDVDLFGPDTMYPSKEEHIKAIQEAKDAGFLNLAKDLATEYYPTIPFLKNVFEENGFTVSFNRCNQFVWIVEAEKL